MEGDKFLGIKGKDREYQLKQGYAVLKQLEKWISLLAKNLAENPTSKNISQKLEIVTNQYKEIEKDYVDACIREMDDIEKEFKNREEENDR